LFDLLFDGVVGWCRKVRGLCVNLGMHLRRVRVARMGQGRLRHAEQRGQNSHEGEQLRAGCPHRHAL
jgi:hypothetical protein